MQPTLYRDRHLRYDGSAPRLNAPKRSASTLTTQPSLRRRKRLSPRLSRPHLSDLIRPPAKDLQPDPVPLRERDLATIAYEDTAPDVAPTTTWLPKPRHTHSTGRTSVYTEIFVPDYGNGLYNPAWVLDANTTITTHVSPVPVHTENSIATPASPSMPTPFPSDAYTRRSADRATAAEDHYRVPPSPTSSTASSSRNSAVPSLSSTYSTEQDSPITPRTTNYSFHHHEASMDSSEDHHQAEQLGQADGDGDEFVQIRPISTVRGSGSEPGLIIDGLMDELEAAGLGGEVMKPQDKCDGYQGPQGLGLESVAMSV